MGIFGWDFRKTAEEVFSRWAMRRLLKVAFKKKLSDYILGDIDLDEVDVQLRSGMTVQLTDLALNVDSLNSLLGSGPLMVKEGSISSLSAKFSFDTKGFHLEVEELELVLAPCGFLKSSAASGGACLKSDRNVSRSNKHKQNRAEWSSSSASLTVHEGVKTIAEIVKLLLTNFHVRLKNVIIAFDPGSEKPELCRILVLRIAEAQFGTCISEDVMPSSGPSILGISKLTNFVKFQELLVEFLEMNDCDKTKQNPHSLSRIFSEYYSENSLPLGFTTKIIGGPSEGFSGSVELSIPWKNGFLDTKQLNAEISISPVQLILLPSTIAWFISLWGYLEDIMADDSSPTHLHMDFGHTVSRSCDDPDVAESSSFPRVVTSGTGNYPFYSDTCPGQEILSDTSLPGPNVIHNWIPFAAHPNDNYEAEPDLAASIHQFFECFDGIRSSQASIGNSMRNIACSVFSAITVASTLVSGCDLIPSEQQNVETRLKATVASVSIALLCHDGMKLSQLTENDQQIHEMCETQYKSFSSAGLVDSSINNVGFQSCMSHMSFMDTGQSTDDDVRRHNLHLLNILFIDLTFTYQVLPGCTKIGAMVQRINVNDNFVRGQPLGNNCLHCLNVLPSKTHSIYHLQAAVQGSLPPSFLVSVEGKTAIASCFVHLSPGIQSTDNNDARIFNSPPFDESCKVTLFESFGTLSGEYLATVNDLSEKIASTTSFSVKLPPFICWVDAQMVNLLLKLCKQVESYSKTIYSKEDHKCDVRVEIQNVSAERDAKNVKQVQRHSSKDLQGNVELSAARIVLCVNLDRNCCPCQIFQWDRFISFDFTGASSEKVGNMSTTPTTNPHKMGINFDYSALYLDCGSIVVYLVTPANADACTDVKSSNGQIYSARKLLSVTRELNNHNSTVILIWQKGPGADPLLTRKIWKLVASKDPSRNKFTGIGDEFAFVTTPDTESVDSQVRRELIRSSGFLLHIHLSLVSSNVEHHDYIELHQILCKVMDTLSHNANDDIVTSKRLESNGPITAGNYAQASILVEFDLVDVCISSNSVDEASKLLQRELSGSWTSLRLKVEKFELLSVSNVGGQKDASFFWLSHGEGDLWGSVTSLNERPPSSIEFLLITCRNSSLRRGDGEGGNAISSGPAGTFIMHLKNPQVYFAFTSIVVRCPTIIAPGCRLDWVGTIISFFTPPSYNDDAENDHSQDETLNNDLNYRTSFLLDLVDVALSYEPQAEGGFPGYGNSSHDISRASGMNFVACILAASSFNLCQTVEDTPNNDINIRLQDLGLLICQWPGSDSVKGYDVDHLRETGYVKIASDAGVAAVVRTKCENDLLWELESSGLHVKLNTRTDTTMGLVCLLGQLQKLFAPDMEDSLSHLQSRWNSTQSAHESDNLSANDSGANVIGSQTGLMDEIVDDIFFYQADEIVQSSSWDFQNGFLENRDFAGESTDLNISYSSSSSRSISSIGTDQGRGQENCPPSCMERICIPEVMDSYYMTELLPRAKHSSGGHSSDGAPESQADISSIALGGQGGWYNNTSLVIVEDHITAVTEHQLDRKPDCHNENSNMEPFLTGACKPRGRVILKNTEMRWQMFGGTDWPGGENKSYDNLNPGGSDQSECLELQFLGVNLQYDLYPEREIIVSNLLFSLQDIFLYDNRSSAPWKMVLGHYHSKHRPRESFAKVLKLNLESVRPDPTIPLEEYRLQLAVLPLRLHLDQSQVNFLIRFFSGLSTMELSDSTSNLDQSSHPEEESFGHGTIPKEALLPFIQKCDIGPIVVRVDYIPRQIDLAALGGGSYIELINLVAWKGIDLELKHVCAAGVYGWGSICEAVAGEWLEDISKNQVHKLLKGLKPIGSLLSVSSGAAKLVSLPVKDFKKDRRLIKGIQRGAVSFLRSISVEAVGLGVHLAAGAHNILLKTECALAGSPQNSSASGGKHTNSIKFNQPTDVHQGMQQAYESLTDGIGRTASAIVGKPLKRYQRGAGAGLAFASAIRAAPAAAIAPASSAARAMHCALLGVRNSLDPEHKRESMEKYNGSSRHQDYEK